jgi:uncharacterized protein YkwD
MSAVTPTAAEQYMIELINRARANPAAEAASFHINLNEGIAPATISAAAKQPVAFNPMLETAARSHSNWMIQTSTFAHNEGSANPGAQMRSAGYAFKGTWTWGQNIAWRGSRPYSLPLVATVTQEHSDFSVDSTVPGRGHRIDMLNPSFKEVGVGIETGTFQGFNAVLATQDYASQSGPSFLTGVAYSDAVARDHFYTPGEGLGGVVVTARRIDTGSTFSTSTWSAGGYALPLAAGTYDVTASGGALGGSVHYGLVTVGTFNVKADFTPGQATRPPSPFPPPTPAPPPPANAFGLIFGSVFHDTNGNGRRDAGETGVANAIVFIDANGDGVRESKETTMTTNSAGSFAFKLRPGTYRLRQILPAGARTTAPAAGSYVDTLLDGQYLTGQSFGRL